MCMICALDFSGFGGNVNWFNHNRKNMEVPQKLKNRATVEPEVQLLSIYPKEMKTGYQRNICTLMFIAALVTLFIVTKTEAN